MGGDRDERRVPPAGARARAGAPGDQAAGDGASACRNGSGATTVTGPRRRRPMGGGERGRRRGRRPPRRARSRRHRRRRAPSRARSPSAVKPPTARPHRPRVVVKELAVTSRSRRDHVRERRGQAGQHEAVQADDHEQARPIVPALVGTRRAERRREQDRPARRAAGWRPQHPLPRSSGRAAHPRTDRRREYGSSRVANAAAAAAALVAFSGLKNAAPNSAPWNSPSPSCPVRRTRSSRRKSARRACPRSVRARPGHVLEPRRPVGRQGAPGTAGARPPRGTGLSASAGRACD